MYLCLAPMDGITTYATRKITQEIFEQYGKKSDSLQLWTEFMNVDGFLINPRKVIKHLLTDVTQKPIAQIYGGNPDTLLEAAKIIQTNYGEVFSGIELNTGCPSTTVMKVGGGSDMMKNRAKTLEIIKQLSETTKIGGLPFSIKTRAGMNEEDKEKQADFLLEASKYCYRISIHGRTLKQLYS
ncbi:MAG: tRNA-dihydrouridine synthase family protein [Candidatus Peribacteria bacterium]|nr:tRNA-dihydrouridine synthase family protein [Candidatus Peribacteria bacterium]